MEKFTLAFIIGLTIKIYALMTPPAVLSAFIDNTRWETRLTRYRIACKASLAIFIIGEVFYFFGSQIFALFGFTIDAFRIGVGVLLFLTAIDLMNADPDARHQVHSDTDISVVPLAIPLGMGPSALGTVMVLGASANGMEDLAVGSLCIFLASLGMALLLCLSDLVEKLIGRTGITVLAKLTALLIAAIAAQVIFTGISSFMGK